MALGYVYMVLSLVSFSLIGIFAKVADTKGCRPTPIYALMYGWALLLSVAFVVSTGHGNLHSPAAVYWIALPFGVASAIAGIAFQIGIRYGKISTSWLVINLSAAIPAVGSLVIYGEPVSPRKIGVLALVALSIFLLWKDKQAEEAKTSEQRS
jgi:drug/metabolite transporter (DMT)-like permease